MLSVYKLETKSKSTAQIFSRNIFSYKYESAFPSVVCSDRGKKTSFYSGIIFKVKFIN